MKIAWAFAALLGFGLASISGCGAQGPPKTLEECQERRAEEIRSVVSGLRNIAPEGTEDAHWFEEGVTRSAKNDSEGFNSAIRVCGRRVREALIDPSARLFSIHEKYDRYATALTGKPWPPVQIAPVPPPQPHPVDENPMGEMKKAADTPPGDESDELRLARAQLATARARVQLEAISGSSPEVQRAAAEEVARLSQLIANLARRDLSRMEAAGKSAEAPPALAIPDPIQRPEEDRPLTMFGPGEEARMREIFKDWATRRGEALKRAKKLPKSRSEGFMKLADRRLSREITSRYGITDKELERIAGYGAEHDWWPNEK